MQNLWTQYQGNSLYQWRCGRYNRRSSDSASRKCFCIFSIRYSKYGIGYGATSGNHSMTFSGLCEKISVNSTTVIKNEIASGLKNSRSIFLQYTINTVICQVSSTVSLLEWSVAEWKQTDCAAQLSLSGYMISSSPRTLPQFLSDIVHFFVIS